MPDQTPPTPPADAYAYGAIAGLDDFNDCVPPWGAMHALTWYARRASTLPPAAHLVGAALPLLAHEAARRGWRIGRAQERAKLQTALVGGAGTGKSTSIRTVADFYRDHLRAAMQSAYTDPWIQVEGSIPGVLEQLAVRHNPKLDQTNAILFHEEFTRVLEHKDSVAETLNQVFDGVTITRFLRQYAKEKEETGWAPNEVRNPAISAVFATTYTGVETATTKRQASGGFYSRLLWFTGSPGYITMDDDPQVSARNSALGVWGGWSAHLDAAELSGEPKVLDLLPQCKALFEGMVAEVNEALRLRPEDAHNAVRLRGLRQARLVAMLYAFSRGERYASLDDTTRALALVRTTVGMTEALSDRWSASANPVDAAVHLAQRPLLERITQSGDAGVRKSELYKIIPVKQQLDLALATLIERELVDECRVHAGGRGRPAAVYKARTVTDAAATGAKVIQFPVPDGDS